MKKQAIWNGQVLAESEDLVQVEGNYYFPKESINKHYFKESSTHTTCPWKGIASYYTLEVDGKENKIKMQPGTTRPRKMQLKQ